MNDETLYKVSRLMSNWAKMFRRRGTRTRDARGFGGMRPTSPIPAAGRSEQRNTLREEA